jgi:transcriptional regulator with XRE-family HTH domain
MKQIKQINSEMQSRRIVQFDLTGKYIAVHNSIKEAVEKTGLSRDAIGDVLRGKRYLSREYIWKYADSFDEIPDQIKVDEYRLPEPAVVPKSRKELNLPEYEYPYQDLHLSDMENEIWKPVPGLEEYCMVSNKGRVKARTRFVDNTNHGRQVLKERIIRQGLRKLKTNPHTGITAQCLYFAIQFDNNLHQMAVARAVYSAFIKPLRDFGEEQIFILHCDLDALNNRVENLYAATRKETAKRNITEGWMVPYDIAEFSKSKKLQG